MGAYAITSATAAQAQLKDVFGTSDATAWRAMALTSMLGTNDVANETFTLADAAEVREFAEEKGISWVSMWSTSGTSSVRRAPPRTTRSPIAVGWSRVRGAFAEAFSG